MPRYAAIAEDLRREVDEGMYAAGELLPSESALSQRYQASRITVRKALERLRSEGVVDSRQGFGWYVVFTPLPQSLERFSTIEEQLSEIGVTPVRKILSSRRVTASGRIEESLGSGEMLEIERVNLADRLPFARVTVWVPAFLADQFSVRALEEHSLYELLARSSELRRPLASAVQTIAAVAMEPRDAALLGVPPHSPALHCERITFDSGGHPVLFSESVFPGSRTEFVSEMTSDVRSMAPTGLRLVE